MKLSLKVASPMTVVTAAQQALWNWDGVTPLKAYPQEEECRAKQTQEIQSTSKCIPDSEQWGQYKCLHDLGDGVKFLVYFNQICVWILALLSPRKL